MQLPSLGTISDTFRPFVSPDSRIKIHELRTHIPEHSTGYILSWFKANPVYFRISGARSSKYGDYRSPVKNFPARISVNRNLNRFDFLLTLVHEMTHHEVYTGASARLMGIRFYRRRSNSGPHGTEWKKKYCLLMEPLLNETVFPAELLPLLENYFKNPGSSARMDKRLVTALKKYDEPDGFIFIDLVPLHGVFTVAGGRKFRKGEKLRKRYRCECLNNGKSYLFSPMARVFLVIS
jgi:SprT protein